MTTRIYLIRHGATLLTSEDRFSGGTEVDLSEEGRFQAQRLALRLAAHPGTRIVPDNGAARGAIKAVTAFKGQCIVTLEGRGMIGIPGIAARTLFQIPGHGAPTRLRVELV